MNIEELKNLYMTGNIHWSVHCLERMNERSIKISDIERCILNGEIIEDYPDDFPHPSCLIFGNCNNHQPLHVVAGTNGAFIYIITAYRPTLIKFNEDFKTRREK